MGFCMTKPYGSLLRTSSRAIKDFITQEFCLSRRKWRQILILLQNFQSLAMNGLCRRQITVAKRNASSRKVFGLFFGCEHLAWQSAFFVAQSNLGHETCFVALSFVVQAFVFTNVANNKMKMRSNFWYNPKQKSCVIILDGKILLA